MGTISKALLNQRQKRVFKQNLKKLIYCRVNLQMIKRVKPMKLILYTITFLMMTDLECTGIIRDDL